MEYSKGKRNRRKWRLRLEDERWAAKAGPVTVRQGQLEAPAAAAGQPAEPEGSTYGPGQTAP